MKPAFIPAIIGTALIITRLVPYYSITFAIDFMDKPLDIGFFHPLVKSPILFLFAYLLAVPVQMLALFRPKIMPYAAMLWIVSSAYLLWHQFSYNDATHLVSFWTGLFLLWYLSHDKQAKVARILVRGILLTFLFGGVVGKLTKGYFDGTVIHSIYFIDRNYWTYNLMRSVFNNSSLLAIAEAYSLFIIAIESLGSIATVIPSRWSFAFIGSLFLGIAVMNNWFLFSVVTCPIALSYCGFILSCEPRSAAFTD